MKRIILSVGIAAAVTFSASAQVWISEILANPSGSDSTTSAGYELFELRGTANMSLAGYYLLSIEGQGTTGRGDINQYFDLGAYSLGANGYLIGLQYGAPYTPIAAGATVVQNSPSQGWGQANTTVGSSIGHYSDGSQLDLENSATTMLLVNKGSGDAPTLSLDLDTNDDGILDLPAGWLILDSVGLMDATGTAPAVTDLSYGAITFRKGSVGTVPNGNVVELPTTGTSLYVARKGESTGSTADDWFGANTSGSAGNFVFNTSSDPFYLNKNISEMVFGGPNPIPEPGIFSLFALGLAGFLLRRRS